MIFKFNFIEKMLLRFNVIPHPLNDAAVYPGLSRALTLGVKLGITDQLSSEYQSAASLAKKCDIDAKGCELVLDCLEALGYLDKSGNQYRFNKRGQKFLAKESESNYSQFVRFGDFIYRSFTELEHTVREGKPAKYYSETYDAEDWQIYSDAMGEIARSTLPEFWKKIKPPANAKQLIDLGGSHGRYCIEMCRKIPGLQATVVDVPEVKDLALANIAEAGMEARVAFASFDFLKDPIPSGNDMALLINIIHIFDGETNAQLFEKVFQSLNPGGKLFIFDQIKGIGGKSQLARSLTSFMALNLFHQSNGNTYSLDEVTGWATKAGFKSVGMKKLHNPGFGLITCEK